MTQQPYPPQYQQPVQPAYPPQQGYPAQQPPPAYYPPQPPAQPQYQQPAPGYPPQQGYGQPPAQAPQVPLAQGSLDQFYSQPSAGGPSIGWKDRAQNQRPIGTTWHGVVARDVLDSDVQQQTDMITGQPSTYRDGRPKFAMKVPLKDVVLVGPDGQPQDSGLTDGEGSWYVRGQSRDELTRAIAEAGQTGAPKAGSVLSITLVNRQAVGGDLNPRNVVQVRYQPAGGQPAAAAPAPQQPPAPPAQQQEGYAGQQYAAYAGAPQTQAAAPQQMAPQQGQAPVPPQYPQPAQQQYPQQAPPQAPQGQAPGQQWDAGQQALFAQITGQPASGQQPAA